MKEEQLKEDLKRLVDIHPQLSFSYFKNEHFFIAGELNIIDGMGQNWGSFQVQIKVPESYPFSFPILFEKGGRIPKIPQRHINSNGSCCVAVEPIQLLACQRGISIDKFINEFALPFFANQILFEENGDFISEYSHGDTGIKEYFYEEIGSTNQEVIENTFKIALLRQKYGRNIACYCGSQQKFKKCHLPFIQEMKKMPRNKLKSYFNLMKSPK